MRPVNLPAGLEDKGVEIYIHKGELRCIYNQMIVPFELLPDSIREVFVTRLMQDKPALVSLQRDFGLSEARQMLVQYIKCNFGNFDGTADIDEDGLVVNECWDCGHRGECPGEGKVCSRLQGPNGLLTRRETEVFFLLISGLAHKQIADHLQSTEATVATQVKMLREKLGCHSSIEVMNFALKRKMLLI